jgi:hypothetical protein
LSSKHVYDTTFKFTVAPGKSSFVVIEKRGRDFAISPSTNPSRIAISSDATDAITPPLAASKANEIYSSLMAALRKTDKTSSVTAKSSISTTA